MQMTQAKVILITISMLFVQPCAKVTIYHFPLQWVLPTSVKNFKDIFAIASLPKIM